MRALSYKIYCFGIVLLLSGFAATAQANNNIDCVKRLIARIAPGKSKYFVLEQINEVAPRDSFYLAQQNDKIMIKGTSALAMAKGFNYYLQNYCHTTVSWYAADVVPMPAALPKVGEPVGESCRFQDRFFLNYCTFGYTMLWWKWHDWERLIDWMALNGINMPLAITGQEYIWQRVWKQFGMTDEQSRRFFTGPAHLPWQRMGNLDRWLGPLPQDFINGQFALQKQILKRERSFGMTPILPAFAGHVPYDLKKKYPDLKLSDLGSYDTGKQNDAYFLDPMDPLFIKIQEAYLSEQQKLLGTNHYYGADPFNEMDPPSWEPGYLASVTKTIYDGMRAIDPQATWVQMGWTFYNDRKHWTNPRIEAMIKGVPQNKMVILEYFGERTELWRSTDAFFGAPYIWCYLGNFGGNTQLAAPLLKVGGLLTAAENDPSKGQMAGIGSTLEGFGVNSFMFEWLYDYAWNTDAANTGQWITNYAYRRCGNKDATVADAWRQALPIVYNQEVSDVGKGNIIQSQPMLKGTGPLTSLVKYDYHALAMLLPEFLKADKATKSDPQYRRDLAVFEKQVLANLAVSFRDSIARAYYARDVKEFNTYKSLFLSLCDDVDRLTGTQQELLLGDWIARARSFGKTAAGKNYYEKNARVLITTWGGKGNGITDYAAKDWSGLIGTYYKKRWEMFFSFLYKTIGQGTAPDMKAFNEQRIAFDWGWANTTYPKQQFRNKASGNTVQLCNELYRKWSGYF